MWGIKWPIVKLCHQSKKNAHPQCTEWEWPDTKKDVNINRHIPNKRLKEIDPYSAPWLDKISLYALKGWKKSYGRALEAIVWEISSRELVTLDCKAANICPVLEKADKINRIKL